MSNDYRKILVSNKYRIISVSSNYRIIPVDKGMLFRHSNRFSFRIVWSIKGGQYLITVRFSNTCETIRIWSKVNPKSDDKYCIEEK